MAGDFSRFCVSRLTVLRCLSPVTALFSRSSMGSRTSGLALRAFRKVVRQSRPASLVVAWARVRSTASRESGVRFISRVSWRRHSEPAGPCIPEAMPRMKSLRAWVFVRR